MDVFNEKKRRAVVHIEQVGQIHLGDGGFDALISSFQSDAGGFLEDVNERPFGQLASLYRPHEPPVKAKMPTGRTSVSAFAPSGFGSGAGRHLAESVASRSVRQLRA
jgi:hypothetical protein